MASQCKSTGFTKKNPTHTQPPERPRRLSTPANQLLSPFTDRGQYKNLKRSNQEDDVISSVEYQVKMPDSVKGSHVDEPICHQTNLLHSNSLAIAGMLRDFGHYRMHKNDPKGKYDFLKNCSTRAPNTYQTLPDTLHNQTNPLDVSQSVSKLFRLKSAAIKLLREVGLTSTALDHITQISSTKELTRFVVDSLAESGGGGTQSAMEFLAANNRNLEQSIEKLKEALDKTRKDWMRCCEVISEREAEIERLNDELFEQHKQLHEMKNINRSSSQIYSYQHARAPNPNEIYQLKQLLGEKQRIIRQLQLQVTMKNQEAKQLKEKGHKHEKESLVHMKQSIVKTYQQYLKTLEKNSDKYQKVYEQLKQIMRCGQKSFLGVPKSDNRIPGIQSSGSLFREQFTSRTLPGHFLSSSKHSCTTSYQKKNSSVIQSSKHLEGMIYRQRLQQIEAEYQQKMAKLNEENLQLKQQLSLITDKCVELGGLQLAVKN